jgi:hypothetical protein
MRQTEARSLAEAGWAPPRERRWRETDGRAMAAAFGRSGKTVGEFADEHGLQSQRVQFWLKRCAPSEQGSGTPRASVRFSPVRLVRKGDAGEVSPVRTSAIEVVLRGGRTVRIGEGALDPQTLRQVVEVLEGVDAC